MKKVVALNGSPRKNGNTSQSIKMMAEIFRQHDITTKIIDVGSLNISGCKACQACLRTKDERCIIDDGVNEIIQELKNADGIIIASPVYFAGMSGTLKCFLDRAFYVSGMNGGLFKHKASGAIAVARRAGTTSTFSQIVSYLSYAQTFMAPSTYWPVIFGGKQDEVLQDAEGQQTMEHMAEYMVYLMETKDQTKLVHPKKSAFTNFIR